MVCPVFFKDKQTKTHSTRQRIQEKLNCKLQQMSVKRSATEKILAFPHTRRKRSFALIPKSHFENVRAAFTDCTVNAPRTVKQVRIHRS